MTDDGREHRPRAWWSALWRDRSRAQRVALIVLGGGLVLAWVVAWTGGEGGTWETLREAERETIEPLADVLDQSGLDFRVRGSGEGRARLEVRSGDHRDALRVAGRSGLGSSAAQDFPWENGPFDRGPTDEQRERLQELRIEEMIRFNPRISDVRFLFTRSERPLFRPPSQDGVSAAVGLRLVPDVPSLTPAEAHGIRQLVSGALNIPRERVRVIDHRGRAYPPRLGTVETAAREAEVRRDIREQVQSFYLGPYEPWEMRVAVMVRVEPHDATIEEIEITPEEIPVEIESESAPDGGATRRTTHSEVVKAKTRRTERRQRGGRLTAVRVNVLLDIAAVRRVLREKARALASPLSGLELDGETVEPVVGRAEVQAYLEEQREFVRDLIPYPPGVAQVHVADQVLDSRTPAETASAPASGGPLVFRPDTRSLEAILWCAAGGVALLLLWFLAGARRRAARRGSAPAPDGSHAASFPESEVCQGTLRLAREASRRVHARPDVAQAILRFWLAADGAAPADAAGSPDGQETGTASEPQAEPDAGTDDGAAEATTGEEIPMASSSG